LTFPLDAFDLTDTEMETVDRARYLLVQECARRFGADLPIRQPGARRLPDAERYGLADEGKARTWAYSADGPPPDAVPWEVAIDSKSRAFLIVNGVDPQGRPAGVAGLAAGGCRSGADRVLGQGTAPDARNPTPDLDDRAWRSSLQDPAVQSAATAWKRCMARAGHSYDNPVEAPYYHWSEKRVAANPHPSEEQRRNGIPPTDAERRAALDDVRCKRESGFLRTWVAADAAWQRRLVAENLDRLVEHRRTLEHLVRNATELLASRSARGGPE
jgi:hypothetical protein